MMPLIAGPKYAVGAVGISPVGARGGEQQPAARAGELGLSARRGAGDGAVGVLLVAPPGREGFQRVWGRTGLRTTTGPVTGGPVVGRRR